jgi:hypothetical protein
LQIPGSKCFVCQQKIASSFVAVGCRRCEKLAHTACVKERTCPECQEALIDGNALYALADRGKLGLRTQAAQVGQEPLSRAVASLNTGHSKATIEADLKSDGMSDEMAAEFAQSLVAARNDRGKKLLWQGGLLCGAGTAFSIASYSVAEPGGSYRLWWGFILFGGIQFCRGMIMIRP